MELIVEGILEYGEIPEISNNINVKELDVSLIFFTSYTNFDIKIGDVFNFLHEEGDVANYFKGKFKVIALSNQLSESLEVLPSGYRGICQIKFEIEKADFLEIKRKIPVVRNWYEYDKRFVFTV